MCCLNACIRGKNELSIQLKKPDNNNKINLKEMEVRKLAGLNEIENHKMIWNFKF